MRRFQMRHPEGHYTIMERAQCSSQSLLAASSPCPSMPDQSRLQLAPPSARWGLMDGNQQSLRTYLCNGKAQELERTQQPAQSKSHLLCRRGCQAETCGLQMHTRQQCVMHTNHNYWLTRIASGMQMQQIFFAVDLVPSANGSHHHLG